MAIEGKKSIEQMQAAFSRGRSIIDGTTGQVYKNAAELPTPVQLAIANPQLAAATQDQIDLQIKHLEEQKKLLASASKENAEAAKEQEAARKAVEEAGEDFAKETAKEEEERLSALAAEHKDAQEGQLAGEREGETFTNPEDLVNADPKDPKGNKAGK
jgi:hypothetical protein